MRRLLAALALACTLAATMAVPAQAQSADPVLAHGSATSSTTAQRAVAIDVPWTYSGPTAAAFGEAGLDVTWTADCPGYGSGSATGRFTPAPGEASVTGVSALRFEVPALEPWRSIPCLLSGHAESAAPGSGADDELTVTILVPVDLNITVAVTEPERTGKPQNQIAYDVAVTNHGNGRAIVRFDEVGGGKHAAGSWIPLVPEAIGLDAGQTVTVPLVVATPYHNGYVQGSRGLRFAATPESAVGGGPVGTPVEFGVQAHVQGFYVPGPSPMLVAVAFAGLALLARRRC